MHSTVLMPSGACLPTSMDARSTFGGWYDLACAGHWQCIDDDSMRIVAMTQVETEKVAAFRLRPHPILLSPNNKI